MDDATRLSRCTQCGADLPLDAAEGLCPACLMAAAVALASQQTGDEATVLLAEGGSASMANAGPRLTAGQSFGPYRIERLLGRGGMGDVYEAEHVEQGRRVALKVLNQRLTTPEDRARFLREGQLAASINHPHTCYIFGSEEILGVPAIAMELLAGGTLKDRVQKDGAFPPAQAVDAILQVVAGLDAAHTAGILHRDIKPANCFSDRDGTVKVGDFGLSISTAARDLSQLTSGFQGTPQFAAPEQLRGEALDVRADIYAVGVTLYYLLTAELPFDDKDLTTLVTRVKQEPPRSPRAIRAKIPAGLAAIVMRCLAKDRRERIQTYAALEDTLRPFSSVAPTPATMGLRFLATAIDYVILSLPLTPLNVMLAFGGHPDLALWLFPALIAIIVAYFGVQEGVWGATIGKRVVGLRVTDTNGRPTGVARASWRAVVFEIPTILTALPQVLLQTLLGTPRMLELATQSPLLASLSAWLVWVLIALLFSTARRRNGFAGVHELASGTRVVRRLKRAIRPGLDAAPASARAIHAGGRRFGPYEVTGTLGPTGVGELLIGFDPSLRRPVWIHALAPGATAMTPLVRDLSRPTRLRWLSGRRSGDAAWDAYEALEGAPLASIVLQPQPWRSVKHWLHDLAIEIDAGLRDGSLPALAVDRVWITRDGHARLLDFLAPGVPAAGNPDQSATVASAQTFLATVARRALDGRGATGASTRPPLPLSAVTFLNALNGRTFAAIEDIVVGLRSLLGGADELARWRRASCVVLCGAGPATIAVSMTLGLALMPRYGSSELDEVRNSLLYLSGLAQTPGAEAAAERAALEVYFASRFGPTLSDPTFWTNPVNALSLGPLRRLAERAIADHPAVSPDDLAHAMPSLDRFLQTMQQMRNYRKAMPTGLVPAVAMGAGLFPVAFFGIIFAGVFRGGVLLRLLGIAVVTRDGVQASRLRTLCRALVAWAPLPMFVLTLVLIPAGVVFNRLPLPAVIALLLGALVFPAGALWAIWRPARGVQDLIARTWLVPR